MDETLRTTRIVADKELEYTKQVEALRGSSCSERDSNPTPSLLNENYEPTMTFFDLRLSDSSNRALTPEKRRKGPTPDDYDLHSLGSYTRTKPVPNKDKKVEELKLQLELEIKGFRDEMECIRGRPTTVTNRSQQRPNSVRNHLARMITRRKGN